MKDKKKFLRGVAKNNVANTLSKISEKDKIIIQTLLDNPEGLRALTLRKLSNLKERSLYRHLKKLEELELIEHISVIWKICQNQAHPLNMTELLRDSKIQIHDISFVVRLIKIPDWWERKENNLRRLKEYQFKKSINWGNNPYTQLLKDNFLIHCFKNSIVFINKKKYWGSDPYDCFIQSLNDFLEAFRYFEERVRFKFFLDDVPQVSVKSNHIVKIGDYLNKRCRKKNDTFEVIIGGEVRAKVDMSDPKGIEFVNKDYAPEDTQRYDRHVEDVIKNNPPLLTELTFVVNQNNQQISELVGNWSAYGMHIQSHIKSIQQLGNGVKTQNKIMSEILKVLQELKR